MAEYKLHGFGESGNAYKCALYLLASGANFEVVKTTPDLLSTPEWRAKYNAMGEVPVLQRGDLTLTQSGVILDYLAQTIGKYGWKNDNERREILRWILFDNHKYTANLAGHRFLTYVLGKPEEAAATYRERFLAAQAIVEKRLSEHDWITLDRPTIADFSMAGYVFYDGETCLDLEANPATAAWRERIRALPNWKGPYDVLPRLIPPKD